MANTSSPEMFQKTSLNNALELCYMLDKHIAKLHTNENPTVTLCKQAHDQLVATLMRARKDVLTSPIPNLENEPDLSYHISLRTDQLIIGIMDRNDVTHESDRKSRSQILFRYSFPVLSVNEWAELNGVQANTVRQWINRGRIQCIKKGNNVGISLMQYDPNKLKLTMTPPLAYAIDKRLDDKLKETFPFLAVHHLIGLRILARSFGKANGDYIVTVTTKDNDKVRNANTIISAEQAETLKRALAARGFENREAPVFVSPLSSDDWKLEHRLPAISMPHPADMEYQKFLREYPSIGDIGRDKPEQSQPTFDLYMKLDNVRLCEVEGILYRTAPDPMSGATGQRQDDIPSAVYDTIEAIRKDTEWMMDNGWANDTMVVTDLTIVQGADEGNIITFLNTLPLRLYSICRILSRRVIILPGNLSEEDKAILKKTGYRCLPNGAYYAYAI